MKKTVILPKLQKPSNTHTTNQSHLLRFLCSASAASVAESCTFPADTTKVRLQLNTTLSTLKQGNLYRTFLSIIKDDGVVGLYKGLSAALLRQAVYGGITLSAYPIIRNLLSGNKDSKDVSFLVKVLSSSTTGAVGQFVATPADVIKIRLQADGACVNKRYHGFLHAAATIYKEAGIAGLWRGVVPSVQRAAVINGASIATYDHSKQLIFKYTSLVDGLLAYSLSSFIAGFSASLVGCPIDVVKTRMINQPIDAPKPKYRSSLHCFAKIFRQEGFTAFYKGFCPTLLRVTPWSVIFYISYEEISNLVFGESQI